MQIKEETKMRNIARRRAVRKQVKRELKGIVTGCLKMLVKNYLHRYGRPLGCWGTNTKSLVWDK